LADTGEVQPWTTLVGGETVSGSNAVVPLEAYWIDTEGQDQLTLEAEILECLSATLNLQSAMSPEGPWTLIKGFSTCPTVSRLTMETGESAAYQMARYIRWNVESASASWRICFRINARSWP